MWLVLAVLGVSSLWAPASFADTKPTRAELAEARDTYREGIALEAARKWDLALGKFKTVAKVKTTPQVRFHIARCQEKLGRWNEAVGGYRVALTLAKREKSKKVIREVESALEALEKKLPKLTIERKPGSESAKIALDGVVLGETALSGEIPVDPGHHRIEATMPGRQSSTIKFEVSEGESKTVPIEKLAPKETAAEPVPTAAPTKPEAKSETADSGTDGPGVFPWLVLGVGVGSLAASGVFFGLRAKTKSTLEDRCGVELQCPESERDTYDRGKMYTTIANVTLGVGVVGVGVGTVLLLTSGSSDSEKAASRPVQVSVHPSGVSLSGVF